ncbi:MAG: DNA-directed RNA polymerase subunit beta [Candidatus Eremiobacterota bacterium]
MSILRLQNPENGRVSFQKIKSVLDLPNLIELQRTSYENFLKEGIKETFEDISPIEDFTGNLILEFLDNSLDAPTYTTDECRDRDATYARPLKVRVRLITKEGGEIKEVKEQEIFMGDFPCMTDKGTFIINGAERVIVSQLVRSPGIYYTDTLDVTDKRTFGATVIPNRGAWLEFQTDANDIISVSIDKARKVPATVLIRALGYSDDDQIRQLFDYEPLLEATLHKDQFSTTEEALIEIYRKQRPGDPPTVEAAQTLLQNLFFTTKRYNLAKVGRYKLSRKLGLKILSQETGAYHKPGVIDDPDTGKTLEYPQILTKDDIISAVRYMLALMKREVLENPPPDGVPEGGLEVYLYRGLWWLRARTDDRFDVPVRVDDIDHLGNRRVRAVGELLGNQFRVGLLRLERVVRERMTVQDLETVTPQALINIRPVVAAIKEFFGSSQLSQFMDQTNSLAELTHKRRLSALGPGGLSRERAGFEVRDVHYSHYGRICPIETPEGPNIGLIGSLATYGRINNFGFIETPYRRVVNKCLSDVEGRVLDEDTGKKVKVKYGPGDVVPRKIRQKLLGEGVDVPVEVVVNPETDYLGADEEDDYVIAQANTLLDEKNRIIEPRVVVRAKHETQIVPREDVDYMDVSPKQIVSVATALIPFLEHDDANRALMGANMQRQAVPLVEPEAPMVGTGMELRAAKDSGALVVSAVDGDVFSVNANEIKVKDANGKLVSYKLQKFKRSNAGTCINQRPAVITGQRVKVGDVIADGASSVNGELALGRNVLVAFMPWEGYNYEDAILISEELVREDVFTSIHIEEYECEARDTKLGAEEITRDIPNVSEEALRDLDERGIIRIGAEVRTEDILVGKVTPKGETELTAEERLLRAIFGEKARDVRDTSLKVPHGEKGKVIDVKVFSRENTDELAPGVNQLVRVYVAQKRKILQGDKMAGRHGNKGVIAKVLPIEDMPYLPDGTPIQIVLNPLGVPSRMNIGQILETHMGLVCHLLTDPGDPRMRAECPVFDSAHENEIRELMQMARLKHTLALRGYRMSTPQIDYVLSEVPLVDRLRDFLNGLTTEYVVITTAETQALIDAGNRDGLAKRVKNFVAGALGNQKLDDKALDRVLRDTTMEDRIREVLTQRQLLRDEAQVEELARYVQGFLKLPEDGKAVLFDGRSGQPYDRPVTVGQIYMLKLAHLVDDKIHARSTGPYSLITQQPLGGKAQFGGQRFGEMEVWALEAYGAAYTLQELLTVKSDDVIGRVKTYEAIVKGENVLEPGVPESFKVLIKELQSLCLDVTIKSMDASGSLRSIEIKSVEDQEVRTTARELGLDIGQEALSSL